MMKKLRLILGDQLNSQHGWFKKVDMNCTYVMMEVKTETNYTKHHYQKIAAFFLSMRQFADELKKKGHQVTYIKLENKKNKQNFSQNLKELIHAKKIEKFEYQLPDEYRLDEGIKKFVKSLKIESQHYDTEHFITSRDSFNTYFKGKKSFLMENFYRKLRMENNILMDGEKPIGGAWNFDKENRKPPKKGTKWPKDKSFKHEAKHIYASLDKLKIKAFGKKAPVHYPISRKESLQVLNHFIKNLLVHFGDYQDAMVTSQNYLYHSKLSFALNVKMLSPLEVIKKVEEVYLKNKKNIKISQVEGFIRQILGWREYVRGLYWNQMPDYKQLNLFRA
jgi:deoxyribodipyrimidine photolyase-related protein